MGHYHFIPRPRTCCVSSADEIDDPLVITLVYSIREEQLIEQGTNADVKKYLFLLYASAASLLGFAGYTAESIYDAVRGYNHRSLFDYSAKK